MYIFFSTKSSLYLIVQTNRHWNMLWHVFYVFLGPSFTGLNIGLFAGSNKICFCILQVSVIMLFTSTASAGGLRLAKCAH